jgi:hypothetical protein
MDGSLIVAVAVGSASRCFLLAKGGEGMGDDFFSRLKMPGL